MALVASAPHYSPLPFFRPSRTMPAPEPPNVHQRTRSLPSTTSPLSPPAAALFSLQSPSRHAGLPPHSQLHPFGLGGSAVPASREKQREELFVDSTRLATLIRRLESEAGHGNEQNGADDAHEDLWLDLYKVLFTIRATFRNAASVTGDEAIQHWSRHSHLFERLAKMKISEDAPRQQQQQHDGNTLAYYAQKSIPATVRDMAGSLAYLSGQDGATRAQLYQRFH